MKPWRLEWVHRGDRAQLWLRLRAGDPPSSVPRLRLYGPSGDYCEQIELSGPVRDNPPSFDARLDLDELLTGREAAGSWSVTVETDGDEECPVVADRLAEDDRHPILLVTSTGTFEVEPRLVATRLTLHVAVPNPWAEVDDLYADDETLHLAGSVLPDPRRPLAPGARVVASTRDSADVDVEAPAHPAGSRFTAQLPLRAFALAVDAEPWRLWLQLADGTRLAAASRLDDLFDKAKTVDHPWRTVDVDDHGGRPVQVRPGYTHANQAVVRARPQKTKRSGGGGKGAAATAPPDGLARRLRRHAFASRRRRRRARGPVRFVITHAYGMGGTIRTVINTANHLVESQPVEIISVYRNWDEPFFAIDERVKVRVLIDQRRNDGVGGGWATRSARAWLHERPSAVVPDDEPRSERFSLLTDLLLWLTLRVMRSGVVVTTRTGLNLIAARFTPSRVAAVAQEHLPYESHRTGLQRQIASYYPRLDAVAVLTEEDAQDYREVLAGAATRVARIPNALPEVRPPRAALRTKRIVTGGRLAGAKGFDLLIEAYPQVAERHPDWELRIYGNGRAGPKLRRMIHERELHHLVRLMGPTDRFELEMAKASLYVLSSRFESFGMVLIEAFSTGLPVVAFGCPRGPREIVSDGVNGLLVDARDIDGLAAGINRMIEDAELRARLAEGALQTASRYAVSAIVPIWRDLFERLTD